MREEEEDGNKKGEDAAKDKVAHDPAVKTQRELRSEMNKRQMDENFLLGDTDKDTDAREAVTLSEGFSLSYV